MASRLKSLRESHIPKNPTYFHNVDDKVDYGNTKETTILEVIDGGLIYKIRCIFTKNNCGNLYDAEEEQYVSWLNVRKKRNYDDIPIFKELQEIRLSFSQIDLSGLFTYKYHFGIDDNQDYQRGFVWKLEDKVSLIDSIFHNVDIGKFVLIHLPYDDKYKETRIGYEVLDGKQRINALCEFYEDRFQYNGKYFSELRPYDKSHFLSYGISFARCERITQQQKYRYFLKLNTGGKPMKKEQFEKVKGLLENSYKTIS